MNIQIDGYNTLTLLISLITLLASYYSLIANRPRIFLKALYVNNNINQNDSINFDRNFNIKFINYGAKPAFKLKIFYKDENYIDSFLDEVTELNLDKDNFRKSIDKSLEKNERNFYKAIHIAKMNEEHLYQKNKKYLEALREKEISFVEGNSYELKKLGIGNNFSKGGLKTKKHSINIEYKDLRDLNMFLIGIFDYIYIFIYLIFVFNGTYSFIPYTLAYISNYTGFFLNLKESKYIRTFKDKLELKIEPEDQYFEYDEYLNKLEDINKSIQSHNIFNEKIYETWEKNLTKSEYKIFKKYRLKYGDNVNYYVKLYKNINKEIPNQRGLQDKLWNLMQIFYEKNIIDRSTYIGLDIVRQII